MAKSIYITNLQNYINKKFNGNVTEFAAAHGYTFQWIYQIIRTQDYVPMPVIKQMRSYNNRVKIADFYPI